MQTETTTIVLLCIAAVIMLFLHFFVNHCCKYSVEIEDDPYIYRFYCKSKKYSFLEAKRYWEFERNRNPKLIVTIFDQNDHFVKRVKCCEYFKEQTQCQD